MTFTPDGKLIVTGWEDGVIRGYLPESGREKFNIPHAHNKGVTAIAVTNDSSRIVSGGGDGLVRVWRLGPQSQALLESMKEHKVRACSCLWFVWVDACSCLWFVFRVLFHLLHVFCVCVCVWLRLLRYRYPLNPSPRPSQLPNPQGAVTDIRVRSNDEECVSSSADGSCIIWDLRRFVRNQIMFASSVFSQVRYRPDEAQLLTCGSDRKVHYWEAFDGSLIRELEVSSTGALYALDISSDGKLFAVGGQDKLLKLLTFDEGDAVYVGQGHRSVCVCLLFVCVCVCVCPSLPLPFPLPLYLALPSLSTSLPSLSLALSWTHFTSLWFHFFSRICIDSGDISRVAICPNQKFIISVTNTGSIFRWAYPNA